MIKALTPSSRVLYTETTMGNKHAYLIMAHDNPEQLRLLIRALDSIRTDIFIHIDMNSDFDDPDSLTREARLSHVEIIRKIRIYWADFSQTECELLLLETARRRNHYEYYHLLSNADFPTKPQEEILGFFDRNSGKEFISFRFPMNAWPFRNKPYTTEIKYYHFLSKHYRDKNLLIRKCAYSIEYFLVFLQFLIRVDRIKGQFIAAKGSNWFSITDSFAGYILGNKPLIEKQFRRTRSSEEVFPAVLAYNSEHFREALYDHDYTCSNNANQRYIDWERGFPYTFRIDDYDEIIASGFPFVRKTDMRIDGGLVQKLYDRIMAASDTE